MSEIAAMRTVGGVGRVTEKGRTTKYDVSQCPANSTQREHRIAKSLQLLMPAKIGQVDNERAGDHRSACDAEQPERRFGRATGGNQVVDKQHALAALNRVTVDLQSVCAIFELVVVTEVFGWQLALLADRYKAHIELVSERGTDDEAA